MFRKYRDDIMEDVMLQRLSVFLRGNEGSFSGVLTRYNGKRYVFEECRSIPTKEGEAAIPYKGRILVKPEMVKYFVDVE